LRCCVAPKRVLYYFSLSRIHRLSSNTVGKIGKRGGPQSKLDWKPLFVYSDFFLMQKKYLYTYTVLRVIDISQNIKMQNLRQIKSHK